MGHPTRRADGSGTSKGLLSTSLHPPLATHIFRVSCVSFTHEVASVKQEQDEPEVCPEVPLSPAQWLSQRTSSGRTIELWVVVFMVREITSLTHAMCCRGEKRRQMPMMPAGNCQ